MKWAILVFLVLVSSSYAALYADVTFEVDETGSVAISGETNYEPFSGTTNELTSKVGSYWLLNITTPSFEEYIYHIMLPPYATINYIKANNPVRIEDDKGTLTIVGTSSNESMNVVVQYSIDTTPKGSNSMLVGGILIVIVIGASLYVKYKKALQRNERKQDTEEKKSKIDRKRFTERQLQIIDYLEKKGTVTQAELEKALQLPKSSLSRNIDALVQKGTIFKESKGMSNVVGLK